MYAYCVVCYNTCKRLLYFVNITNAYYHRFFNELFSYSKNKIAASTIGNADNVFAIFGKSRGKVRLSSMFSDSFKVPPIKAETISLISFISNFISSCNFSYCTKHKQHMEQPRGSTFP